MTTQQCRRLAELRSQLLLWSAQADTSTWDSTFFLEVIDELQNQLKRVKVEATY